MASEEDQGIHGKGKTLDEAIQNAWDNAPKEGHTTFVVKRISVEGHNPLTGYIVTLAQPGG
jgi:hypothetical protein